MPRIIIMNKPAPLSCLHQRSSSDLSATMSTNDDTPSTKTTINDFAPPRPPKASPPRRAVHFDTTARVHVIQRVSADQASNVWYTRADLARFHTQTQQVVHQLLQQQQQQQQQQQDDSFTWSQALLHVYQAFRGELSQTQLVSILQQAHSFTEQVDERTLGLEMSGAIPAIADDFVLRRQHLLHQIQRLQAADITSPLQREAMICETSRLTSRAARMFAGYIAHMAAAANHNEV